MRKKNRQSAIGNWQKKIVTLLLMLLCFVSTLLFSQVNISAKLDTNAILIGQQVQLRFTANYRADKGEIKISFPNVADSIIKNIEVVGKTKVEKIIDTADQFNFTETQTLTLTSFDSGYYAIPPFKFTVNGDTNETEALLLAVHTIVVDTSKAIKDIKPPIQVPFSWKDYLPYLYWTLGVAAIIMLLYFLIKYLTKKKPKTIIPEAPKIPAHITALQNLEKLREKKLWQEEKYKLYHSELTEIIRSYIERRFHVPALEQTTDEIIFSFRSVQITDELKNQLRQTLIIADMVKFAKEIPLPNENEICLQNAFDFVNATIPVEQPVMQKEELPNA